MTTRLTANHMLASNTRLFHGVKVINSWEKEDIIMLKLEEVKVYTKYLTNDNQAEEINCNFYKVL